MSNAGSVSLGVEAMVLVRTAFIGVYQAPLLRVSQAQTTAGWPVPEQQLGCARSTGLSFLCSREQVATSQQSADPEFPESTRPDRRASAGRGPQRRSEALAEFHGLESEVGASGVQLNAENRCGFGSKSNSLRMGGLPRRGFAAARLLPLALVLRRVGRVPGTMSASAPMCVALYVK